jgi:hypothetical protein
LFPHVSFGSTIGTGLNVSQGHLWLPPNANQRELGYDTFRLKNYLLAD